MRTTWALHQGDCLAMLPTLADASVSHVVTDPPYGQTNEKYDSDIVCRPDVWRECYRICRDGGALLALAGSPTYHRLACAIEAAGWRVRQMWAWIYRDGLITSAWPKEGFDRLAPAMTPIVYATKGKSLLTLERVGEPWRVRFHQSKRCDEYSDRATNRSRRTVSGVGRWPRSVVATGGLDGLQYFVLSHNASNRSGSTPHPNEKPLPLMEWLCEKLSRGVVLDPFAGSGSTLAAALNVGHETAIGIEQNPAYCDIIRRRMAAEQAKCPLFSGVT